MHGENISNLVWDLLFRQLKPKVCPFDKLRAGSEQRRRIQNLKLAGFLALFLVVGVGLAQAQQPKKVPRIGYLCATPASSLLARTEAFRQGLKELGYIEGKNIALEYRWAEGKFDRLPDLAAELVRLKVDVIVTCGPAATPPAKEATITIPLVMWVD